ncbi:hypothetical protein OK074_7551 [Actinobacteria bacterium OK074]|nr:hypothetical protein OK074_7551 [Actinobacteria bacterium OK074]
MKPLSGVTGLDHSVASPDSYGLAEKFWTERPAKADVEAVVRGHFSLFRAGRVSEARQLVDHHPVRHVLKPLWTGSADAGTDEDEASGSPAADEWEQELSCLGALDLSDFHWGHTAGLRRSRDRPGMIT